MSCSSKTEQYGYHSIPGPEFADRSVSVPYITADVASTTFLDTVLAETPKPKGRTTFSSVHIIAPESMAESPAITNMIARGNETHVHTHTYTISEDAIASSEPMREYTQIFEIASALIENRADRASLLVFVGSENVAADAYAVFIGMLPFRGITVALLSQRKDYDGLTHFKTASGVFEVNTLQAQRLGLQPLGAVYGTLPSKNISAKVNKWVPVEVSMLLDGGHTRIESTSEGSEDEGFNTILASTPPSPIMSPSTMSPASDDECDDSLSSVASISSEDEGFDSTDAELLPFKIGGLQLPMITHSGDYYKALADLATVLNSHYTSLSSRFFPIVSCGETCTALGYGADTLEAVAKHTGGAGFLFSHKSGETYKRFDNFGSKELFAAMQGAKKAGKIPVILAVGGGINGNSIGLIAGITGCDFIEVPTTPMHYNDATTSAKQAVSLVKNDTILSKNILGAFYLPQLVFCVSEMFLTISSASVHSTVGEACKTMNMLGVCNSKTGAKDYHDIDGACEFASDYSKMVKTVAGFDLLIDFVQTPQNATLKKKIINLGHQITSLQQQGYSEEAIKKLVNERKNAMKQYRKAFYSLPEDKQLSVKEFFATINYEVVSAKAMFLAYSDPFEKYRALLFEYAHTLGHGIEAFANGMYTRAKNMNVTVPEDAFRLHGQCVGMAVQWAGAMSHELNLLSGHGLDLHQSFVYLFNRNKGFTFAPLRKLAERLGVTREDLIEGVLKVVRRDNKRGYCKCGERKSVDQLVVSRPGRMVKSNDPSAALRYLVEVDEDIQAAMLSRAWDGEFDCVADLREGKLEFVKLVHGGPTKLESASIDVAHHIHKSLHEVYNA